MKVLTVSDTRSNLSSVLDTVVDDREATVITRSGKPAVVLVSIEEWDAMQETLYLLRSPANAAALARSIDQADTSGDVEVHDLVDPGDDDPE